MKQIILSAFLFVLSSCSLFNQALNKSKAQEKMVAHLKNEPYGLSLEELKGKVGEFIQRGAFEGTWVFVSQPGHQDQHTMDQIDKTMKDGFFYKGKLYTSEADFDITALYNSKARDDVFKAKYHLIEDSKDSFTIVHGSTIYVGRSAGADRSFLDVSKLTAIYRPTGIDFDWWSVIRGKGLSATFMALPVDFQMSRKHQEQDKPTELSFLYWLDETRAKKLEAELASK